MKRRSFLMLATLAGGSLLVGCADVRRQQLRSARLPLEAGQIALNGWVKLATDGSVSVVVPKAEMGQGVHTALAMLVAEELDCGWSRVRLADPPIDPLYGNIVAITDGVPFRPDDDGPIARGARWALSGVARQLGIMMTGGSSSLRDLWVPMREAGASMRAALTVAVARHWKVDVAQVMLADGVFTGPDAHRADFGEAVAWLSTAPAVPDAVVLKTPDRFRLIGTPVRRIEGPAKADGSARFAGDVRPDGLLYAAVRMAPTLTGNVRSLDDARARKLPGVAGVVRFDPAHGGVGGVAVVADRRWRAVKALEAVDVTFDAGERFSTEGLEADLLARLDADEGFSFWKQGDADGVLASAGRKVEATYFAPYLAHAAMEPTTCTVVFHGDRATVWAPTQVPGLARRAAARALGLEADRVDLQATLLGGGFGRRLDVDSVAQAAQIARAFPGRPVQVLWSREDDIRHDFYRPACVARYAAALDAQGGIAAWRAASAGQAITPAFVPRNLGVPVVGPDKTAAEGAFDPAYAFPAVRVTHLAVDLPVPVGYLRSVGHSHHAFFKESFVDECAHAAGVDPLEYRRRLLAQQPRQRAVLDLAASKAGWGMPLPTAPGITRRARGIAMHESFGATVAQVAEVSIGSDGALRVHRVTCAIDCGIPVNPNLIAQQMESAIVFGLSAALYGRIDIVDGRVVQGNFHDYPLLRMNACPQIDTHIVPSVEPPEGVGEPGVPPIAPAVANAVFALTGKRLRSLPLALPAVNASKES